MLIRNKFEIEINSLTPKLLLLYWNQTCFPARRESKAVQKEYGLDTGANPPCSGFVQVTETMTNFNFISAPETYHSQI